MSWLQKVETGKRKKPIALMFYGVHGIGKSTFPSEAPEPIYVGSEENDELEVARMPKVRQWSDLEGQLYDLLHTDHGFKTVVIDTLDSLEQIAAKEILKGHSGKTLATVFGGFGKGYEKMRDMFAGIRDNYLIPLRDQKEMNVILLAHSVKEKHEDPITNTSYDHYSTALDKRIKPIFHDWVSAILFANYLNFKAENSEGKEYLEGDGQRVIFTEERPSHIAKNRFGLPYEVEFNKEGTYQAVSELIHAFYGKAKKAKEEKADVPDSELHDLKCEVQEKLKKMPDELKPSIELAIKRAKENKADTQKRKNCWSLYGRVKRKANALFWH